MADTSSLHTAESHDISRRTLNQEFDREKVELIESVPVAEPLRIAVPTHDMRAVIHTTLELAEVSHLLNRPIQFLVAEASNIPRGRNTIIQQLRAAMPEKTQAWILWVDSDIWIPEGTAPLIVDAIRWAETHQAGIVANYKMANGESVLMTSREPHLNRHYTAEEVLGLPDYTEIGMAGLGFAYLPQPLDYQFHADALGEDIHFWWDYPDLHIYFAKRIHLGHKKIVMLT